MARAMIYCNENVTCFTTHNPIGEVPRFKKQQGFLERIAKPSDEVIEWKSKTKMGFRVSE